MLLIDPYSKSYLLHSSVCMRYSLLFPWSPNQSCWSTSELRVGLAPWNQLRPSSKIFLLTVPRYNFLVDHLCYLCLVFVMLSLLFIVALWSPAGKGLTSWLLFAMFNCVLSLSHVVSWVRCGTDCIDPDLCCFSYFVSIFLIHMR